MIDWVTAKLPLAHAGQLCGGRILNVTQDGEVEYDIRKWLPVEGSFSSKISIKTAEVDADGNGTLIALSGNPVKWIQGHNIFGSDDLTGLVYEAMTRICAILEIIPSQPELSVWANGDYSLSRIDINGMYALANRRDVNAWLHAAQNSARTRMGPGLLKGGTLYWGKHSSRWTLKAYSKGEEIMKRGHTLPPELSLTSLPDYADNMLRLELTLRQKELKKLGLDKASNWENIETEDIYCIYRDRLQMSEQTLQANNILDIPSCVRGTYQLWKEGHDCRQLLADRTYYRHRNVLRKHGVDISIPNTDAAPNVVPLIRTLEAAPVGIPDWAEGTKLYFEPASLNERLKIVCK